MRPRLKACHFLFATLLVTFCLYPPATIASNCDPDLATRNRNLQRLENIRSAYLSIPLVQRAVSLRIFLQNRELIPEGGTVYVVGPGLNFYEWMAFLVAREDVTVVVFEAVNALLIEQLRRDSELIFFWEALLNVNPELLTGSSIRTFEQFKHAIHSRLILKGAFGPHAFIGSEPILADVIFANYPHDIYELRDTTPLLKPNGLIWVQTENLERHTSIQLSKTVHIIEERNIPSVKFLSARLPTWTRPYWNQPLIKKGSQIVVMRGYFPVMFQSPLDAVYFIIPN